MTISSALSNALSGLRANGRMAEVTANNLANALTPGYARQSVTLDASVTGGQGTGVAVAGVERAIDPDLTAARRIADGDLAEASGRLDGLARLERALGTVEDPSSLANRVTAFEDALRTLAETPESGPRQTAAAEAARDLADKMNMVSTESARVRQAADAEIARRVEEVNKALDTIARLNRQIQIFESAGRDTAAMIDERERLIDRVAQNVPIRVSQRPDNTVEVRTAQGLPLADTTPRKLVFSQTGSDGLALTPPPVGAPPGTPGRDITPGGSGPQRIQGGALAGLFELRDRIVPEFEAGLDALAADLITRTENSAADPTVAFGDYGLFTDDSGVFDPAAPGAIPTGLARDLRVSPMVDPAVGGEPWRLRDGLNAPAEGAAVADPALIRAMLDRVSAPQPLPPTVPAQLGLTGSLSLSGRTAQIAELSATARVRTEAQVSALGTTRETLATEEGGLLGVDQDTEMQRLVQIEQAYAANAQVIQTAARMLDELTRIR